MKKALDPQVKKASQAAVNKIKTDIKNKNKVNNMAGKTEKVYIEKPSEFGGLKGIVEMRKQKAIANELDSMIFEQELSKKQRLQGNSQEQQTQKRTPSPIEIWLAANMDKLKDMSEKEVTKLSMLINPSGGSELSTMMAIMNMKGDNNGGGGLSDKLLGVIIEKMFNDKGNDKKSGNGDMDIIKMMMAQNMKTQEMIMNMVIKQNAPKQENQSQNFMKEIFGMIKGQSDFENTMLREKLKELELRQNQTDPLGEAKRMIDFINTFKPLLGGGNPTPEAMNHEIKLKEMAFDQQKITNEEQQRATSMNQIQGMVNNTIETLGKVFGEPVAEAAKAKIEQYTENIKNPEEAPRNKPRMKVSKGQLQKEIDLGDLENLEEELAQYEDQYEVEPRKTSRFKVAESGK